MFACGRPKGSGYEGYAFVANEDGQAVAIVDLTTFTLARHVRLDSGPTAVVSPTDRPAVYALTPKTGCVHAISVASLTSRGRAQVARSAISMRVSPGSPSALWVLCRQPRQLVRVGLTELRAELSVALPFEPRDFDLAPDGRTAVVSSGDSGQLAFVNLARRSCHVVDLGRRPSLVRFRGDGHQVLVACAEEPLLTILDGKAGRVVVDLPLGVRAQNLCFKSDGGQLFVTGEGMDAVVIVYPYTTEVAETVLAGRAPGYMAECVTDDADYLFVANPESGEATILDIDTRKVVAVVGVGRRPVYVTQTPDQQYALVLNQDSGDMAVVRLAAVAGKRDRSAPLFTMIPVGSKPVCTTVRHA
jgi:YVTN family beta-propeller protein